RRCGGRGRRRSSRGAELLLRRPVRLLPLPALLLSLSHVTSIGSAAASSAADLGFRRESLFPLLATSRRDGHLMKGATAAHPHHSEADDECGSGIFHSFIVFRNSAGANPAGRAFVHAATPRTERKKIMRN